MSISTDSPVNVADRGLGVALQVFQHQRGQTMRLDFTLERPLYGTPLYGWTLIVDGCDTGNILYNGEPDGISIQMIPTLSQWGLVLFAALLLAAFFWIQKARRDAARP